MTALIYVVIIVALVTYFIMFNINSLAQGFRRVYDDKKKYIILAMKKDHTEAWKQRGQRFEVFRPKHENPEPSEWYIPYYALLHPAVILGLGWSAALSDRRTASQIGQVSGPSQGGLARFFRKRRRGSKEEEQVELDDQPWVIGHSAKR